MDKVVDIQKVLTVPENPRKRVLYFVKDERSNLNIVLPDETEGLAITKGMDYCTLVTCTPYGVNTHRLLVRGKRVDYKEESRLIVPADASKYSPLLIAPFLAIPILVILFIYVMMATSGHHPGKKE